MQGLADVVKSLQDTVRALNSLQQTLATATVTKLGAAMITGSGSPVGVITAPKSTFYTDVTANHLYVNLSGGTAWTLIV